MRLPIKDLEKLRGEGKFAEVFDLLDALKLNTGDDPMLAFQYACTLDSQGREEEAIPYYRKAIALKLKGTALAEAYLGLGSSLRALGRYQEASVVLEEGSRKFGRNAALQTFYAMALYNTGECKEAVESLLILLAETSKDRKVRAYREVLLAYAEDLDKTW